MRRETRHRLMVATFGGFTRRAPQLDTSVPPRIRNYFYNESRERFKMCAPHVHGAAHCGQDLRERWIREMAAARTARICGDSRGVVVRSLRCAGHARLDTAYALERMRVLHGEAR